MNRRITLVVAGLALVTTLSLVAPCSAATITVGPGGKFTRMEEALAKAAPGDEILVSPLPDGKPYEKVALLVTKPRLTIKAAADKPGSPRVALSGKGFDYSGRGSVPRAIVQFDKGADGCVVEGFDLSLAHNESHNGAGVRINQANDVTIRNCRIHHNDMGIMSNGDGTPQTAVNQSIERCLIDSNGDAAQPGYNHNLYLGGTSVRLVACEVHSSVTGHNVKSRAHRTMVLYSYIHDSANREFDLVDAKGDTTAAESHAWLVGNVIVKAAKCTGNGGVIHFGQDGGNEHDGTLTLAHNTIVTPYTSPVVALSAAKAKVVLLNNIVWDAGTNRTGQKLVDLGKSPREAVSGSCNWLAAGFAPEAPALPLTKTSIMKAGAAAPFTDAAKGDYRLVRAEQSIVDSGAALPPELLKLVAIGNTLCQYKAPLSLEPRTSHGKNPDLGAYEFVPTGK